MCQMSVQRCNKSKCLDLFYIFCQSTAHLDHKEQTEYLCIHLTRRNCYTYMIPALTRRYVTTASAILEWAPTN